MAKTSVGKAGTTVGSKAPHVKSSTKQSKAQVSSMARKLAKKSNAGGNPGAKAAQQKRRAAGK